MKKSQRKPLKEKSSDKCYNKSNHNTSERDKGRVKLKDSFREKEPDSSLELFSMITQGLLML